MYICNLLYAYCTRTRLTSVLWKTDNAMAATRSLTKRADTLLVTLATEQVNEWLGLPPFKLRISGSMGGRGFEAQSRDAEGIEGAGNGEPTRKAVQKRFHTDILVLFARSVNYTRVIQANQLLTAENRDINVVPRRGTCHMGCKSGRPAKIGTGGNPTNDN